MRREQPDSITSDSETDWFDHPSFANQLDARVVDERHAEPRIRGFEVLSDLVPHFSFVDLLLMSMTGKEPSARTSEALRRAMVILAPLSAGSAPTHLGILAELISRNHASSVAAGAAALAERAEAYVADRAPLLQALRSGGVPTVGVTGPEETSSDELVRLFEGCAEVALQPWFPRLDRVSAALSVLYECGLTESWQLESALYLAWSPCMLAEMGTRRKDPMENYPINVPRFRHVSR